LPGNLVSILLFLLRFTCIFRDIWLQTDDADLFFLRIQMGIGRTTTGTVTACLLKLRIDRGRPIRVLHDASNPDLGGDMSSGDESEGQSHPPASVV